MLRLLKRLYLVFFRGDLDKILQRHLEMMKVYLSDRALHGHVMLGHSLTNWEIVERLLFVWKTRKFRKEFICNGSSRWKFFREKSNAFRGITFFPFLPKGPKFPLPFFLDYQCQAPSREKAKNLPVFCKWYNSIPFLFSVPQKNTSDILRKFFTEISVQMVSAPDFVSKFNLRKEQKTVLCNFKLLKNDRSKLLVMSCIEQILHSKQVHPTTECFKIRQTCLK